MPRLKVGGVMDMAVILTEIMAAILMDIIHMLIIRALMREAQDIMPMAIQVHISIVLTMAIITIKSMAGIVDLITGICKGCLQNDDF